MVPESLGPSLQHTPISAGMNTLKEKQMNNGMFLRQALISLSAISDRPLHSLDRNDPLVPRSRTSTSQQCAFASAGPLLWNCLPVKTRAQILSTSLSSRPRPLLLAFLSPFFFLGRLSHWRAPLISFYCAWRRI